MLQLEDSLRPVGDDASEGDYLVTALDLRTAVEELWLAGAEAIAINGERVTPTTAVIDIGSSVLVNSAYLAPPFRITALGPDDLYATLSASPGFVDLVRARADALRDPDLVRGAGVGRPASLRGHDHAALRPTRCRPRRRTPAQVLSKVRAADMTRRRNQVTIAAVMFVLGILVVVQLRAQTEGSPLAQLSSQDLTVLVANLNGRNDQLRREVATLERDLASLSDDEARGEISMDDLRAELERVRAYAGLSAVVGQRGHRHDQRPHRRGRARGARQRASERGAEAISIAGVRDVPGLVAEGVPGQRDVRWRRRVGRLRGPPGHRRTGQAHGVAHAPGRGHRPARGDPARGRRHGHAGGPAGAPGDGPGPRPDPRSTTPLIP